ncbi:glycosyltransferase [Sorangium cellulosum]|jgi:glycosyltransferase involved in cell wall biosynthesis|uniref:Glycosyltransferase n=1 Tax=Sorangium cellulosum TaxID=56 RepID=A0A4P2Q912_SORCE|nr:glycosyltransferase family 2 protein [Sorangium cellulosum]AUX25678.1 glycosyltransferase [Sorangium cellulosum]
MRICAIIPAYQAERNVGDVTREALRVDALAGAVFVVDDGSSDRTAERARAAGASVLLHPVNLGKGAALRTGMEFALAAGFDVAITLDADGQHPPDEARRLLDADADPEALVLGVRDLVAAGAPRANQISNRISNFFLSLFAGRPFADTQCGLRRYPLRRTLSLDARDDGYAFEAEILLRAVAAGVRIVEAPTRVIYPPEDERLTHFDSVRDPARIVARVVATLALTRGLRHVPAAPAPFPPARRPAASPRVPDLDPRPSQPTAAPP